MCELLYCSIVKYHQLQSDPGAGRKYAQIEETDLSRVLTQTDIFIETCNVEQIRYVTDYCEFNSYFSALQ